MTLLYTLKSVCVLQPYSFSTMKSPLHKTEKHFLFTPHWTHTLALDERTSWMRTEGQTLTAFEDLRHCKVCTCVAERYWGGTAGVQRLTTIWISNQRECQLRVLIQFTSLSLMPILLVSFPLLGQTPGPKATEGRRGLIAAVTLSITEGSQDRRSSFCYHTRTPWSKGDSSR